MKSKILYILVGVPGSGKSSYAKKLNSNPLLICEADNFPGLYNHGKIDFSKLETAHIYSRMCIEENMKLNKEKIVQSNTNLDPVKLKSYLILAEKYEYEVHIILPKYDLLYFEGIKDRKLQIQHLLSVRGADRPNSVESHVGYKHIPKEKILSMVRKFDKVKPIYEKLTKIHDPEEILKFFKDL
jgi:hypothetical protein